MKFKVNAMMLVLLMCWASQSLAQPKRACNANPPTVTKSMESDPIDFIQQTQIEFALEEAEMFLIDSLEPMEQIVVAQASQTQSAKHKKEYVMGTCIGTYQIEKDSEFNVNTYMSISSILGGIGYAKEFWGIKVPDYIKPEHIEVLRPPKHGNLFYEAFRKDSKPGSAYGDYNYVPERGYLGTDKVTFKITVGERVFKVVYVIKVVSQHDVVNDDPSMYCTKTTWKISSTAPDGIPTFTSDDAGLIATSDYALSLTDFAGRPSQ